MAVAIARALLLLSCVLHQSRAYIALRQMSKRGAPAVVVPASVPEDIEFNVVRPSGLKLPGTLTVPQGAERPEGPVAIFLHGTMSNRNHNFVPDLAAKLVKDHDIRSFRFDFRVGKTEQEPQHRYKFSGYKDDLDDMECAIAQLKRSGYTPFCLFGHSRGANDALLYASTRLVRDGADTLPDTVFARVEALSVADAPSSSTTVAAVPRGDDILLNPAQLCVVCAAPRFQMPNMLPTLFAEEKVALLATEGQFVWYEVSTSDPPPLTMLSPLLPRASSRCRFFTSSPPGARHCRDAGRRGRDQQGDGYGCHGCCHPRLSAHPSLARHGRRVDPGG